MPSIMFSNQSPVVLVAAMRKSLPAAPGGIKLIVLIDNFILHRQRRSKGVKAGSKHLKNRTGVRSKIIARSINASIHIEF